MDQEKKAEISEERLMTYFKAHKETYREPERRLASYWVASPEHYEKTVVIDDGAMQQFYTKEKDGLFRVPPRVKTRRLLVRREASGDPKNAVLKQTQELRAQLVGSPDSFAEAVVKHSQDTETASTGGLIDFFDKGTHDPVFERAAFRLKNTGEISPVITTKEGYELIQLVERIPASSKTLESVREEIETTLRSKKALQAMKADVSLAVREARNNPEALNDFAKKLGLKNLDTGWIARGDTREDELANRVGEQVYSDKKKTKAGSFTHEDDLIVFQVRETKQSFVPPFEEVRKDLLADYQRAQASKKMLAAVDAMRRAFHHEKRSLEDVAKAHDLGIKTTGWLKFADGKGDDNFSYGLLQHAASLADQRQLATAREDADYYLIGLHEIEPADPAPFAASRKQLRETRSETGKRLSLEAFIASLQRHATIETLEKAPLHGADFSSQDYF